ncbi:MAG: hypothetical protein GY855_00305 [candidate division Zixibacteria bacterium]|nr:hypothetical protein [candidate division Zixibacteria bacterium]
MLNNTDIDFIHHKHPLKYYQAVLSNRIFYRKSFGGNEVIGLEEIKQY